MKREVLPLGVVGALLGFLLLVDLAHAQATRTWVSGVGDDVNPCSRTAPCKTFTGAISKTLARGEISVLDPGGFGAVTITKAISIVNDGSTGGILAALVNGVIVNAGASDVVVLRGLDINGAGTGLNGIRFLMGGALHVENCVIYGFTQKDIDAEPSTASQLFVKDTIVRDNNTAVTGGGIFIRPPSPGNLIRASLDNVRLERNLFGLRAEGNAQVTVRRSVASGNSFSGFSAFPGPGGNVEFLIEDSMTVNNGANGVLSRGASTMVRLSNVTITGNTTGLFSDSGGALISFGNNRNHGNDTDGAPTLTIPLQ